ncbi:CaiB/BaiF CoA transferase family protein [Acidiplasma aeolicum]|uniref:Formyl-CoA transferase n=1 Tax=Acidiplasma aeolicum TaxID=507754 RepID=A0A0N8VKM9_9ARCH|nr:CaiB/BaiF CoA-transferase family protein [Acidiplasma aeolicum]KQB34172.1 hypothetical protein AOG54_01420 [Acidiplasma aeolicum]
MESLKGLKVLDFTQAMSGPVASMILGDLGADVIKVEPPAGDQSRSWAPPFIDDESAYYISVNRNKKSICMDLKHPDATEIIKKLVEKSDIVIENFRPGTAKKLGIDYESLKNYNNKIIYCSISGFGQTGPDASMPSYDLIALARSGLMSITGEKNGDPVKFGVPITDITSGLFATISILAALNYRNITGRGQYIDISMLDVNSYLLVNQFMNYIATGINPERLGSAHPSIVPYQVFKAGDDYIAVTVGTEKLWGLFCSALNIENLKNDDRFSTNEKRLENRDELINIINNEFKKYTVDELIKKFNEYGIPCSRVNKISDVIMDKQLNYREMIKDVHFGNKNIKMLNSPFKMSETPGGIRLMSPRLGEHSREILKNLGFSDEKIKDLINNKTVSYLMPRQ